MYESLHETFPIEFGRGSFVGDFVANEEISLLGIREQALLAGRANGCPVALGLTDPESGRGPETMLRRYGEVNFWFGFISRTAQELNTQLYNQLSAPVVRMPGETVGKYEPESVPESHLEEMAPMGTLAGYAAPRLFVEQLGTNLGLEREEVQARLVNGLDILDWAVSEAHTPLQLLALLAEGLTTKADTTPEQALKHIMSRGWLEEHNAQRMMTLFKEVLEWKAPTLWAHYQSLSSEGKDRLKIV